MATALCQNPLCQKTFYAYPYALLAGISLYCSRECYSSNQRRIHRERTSVKCFACGIEKPIEDFYVHKTGRLAGLTVTQCKACGCASRKAHPERNRETSRRYRLTHREETQEAVRSWYRANPTKEGEYRKRRRARKAGAPINDFTAAQWVEMQAAFKHRCAYCGKRAKGHLTQDHVTPLTQGGSHTAINIVPACGPCNSKKHTGPPPVPIQPLLLTMAPAKRQKKNI